MKRVRTITLELLRHGPAHNQLLSPLTRYLALCGNQAAVTVTVPFEHEHFLTRLRALRYKMGKETDRVLQLRETATAMAGILGEIPGLIAELSSRARDPEELTHLELVLSASELALLPFELADGARGFPAAGQPLALQAELPMSITRKVRRVDNPEFEWPTQPRILLAAAAPPGVGTIPLESHLLELRQAIDPWVHYYPEGDVGARKSRIGRHLTVLPRASISEIEQACRRRRYTHVHLLAHGIELKGVGENRFGLALHDSRDPNALDRVSGSRLAGALRTYRGDDGLSAPAVVSLASCDSGQVGGVIGAGASVAHALHQAGIPLVVASQFPLTFAGSILMVRELYRSFLWGRDPRTALARLRGQLHNELPNTHDWASVVVYTALPANIDDQLHRAQREAAKRSIDAALNHTDAANDAADAILASGRGVEDAEPQKELFRAARDRLWDAKKHLRRLAEDDPRSAGLLAGAEKREAQVLDRAAAVLRKGGPGEKEEAADLQKRTYGALYRSLDYYRDVYTRDPGSSWAIVQYLALIEYLGKKEPIKHELWTTAWTLAQRDVEMGADRQKMAWAHGSLAELCLLSVFYDRRRGSLPSRRQVLRQAADHARRLVSAAPDGRDGFTVYSTKRQFARYTEWFHKRLRKDRAAEAMKIAEAVLKHLGG